jgi:hypothetical protein
MRIGSLAFVLAAACSGGGETTPDAMPLPECVRDIDTIEARP